MDPAERPRKDPAERRRKAAEALAGYANGPNAPIEATATALEAAESARAVVLVEGISDQIALETLAHRRQRNLQAEGVVIVPIGGAQAIMTYLRHLGPGGADKTVTGLCDAAEEGLYRRALARHGLGPTETRADLERAGFFTCVEDLEDELIRATGRSAIEQLLDSQGDLGSFRTMQKQPAWRDQPFDAQLRRFLGAGARRKLRYARLLIQSVELGRVPHPLDGVLASAGSADQPGRPR